MASDNEASCESDPNFAVICAFMEKFGVTCGLAAIDFLGLQAMLENTTEVSQELVDLHIKLLRKSRKSVSTERWERAIVKFCHTFCMQDAWEIERFGYKKARLSSKLRVLKELLEMQFDFNVRFKQEINKMSSGDLRSQPLGKDNKGHAYWYQSDNNCQIRVYKEDPDEETWTLVANDRDGLVSLINDLKSGDEKRPPEPPPNEEDSNSLTEKPIIDTGQIDSSSDSTVKKISEESSENSNESITKVDTSEDDKKRARESDEEKENETKKAKSNEEEKIVEKIDDAEETAEVDANRNINSEEIIKISNEVVENGKISDKVNETNSTTEKVDTENVVIEEKTINEAAKPIIENLVATTNEEKIVIEEKTILPPEEPIIEENLKDKDAVEGKNEEVGEAIEEPLMLVKGEGTGKENECLNPIIGEAIEEDLMFFYGCGSGYDCETGNDDKEEAASSTNNVSIKESETNTSNVSLNIVIDSKTDNNTSDDKNSTKDSKWDVETIIAKEEHEVPKKFFFGPPSSQISPATVGFGQKVPKVEKEKGDIGYRIQEEEEDKIEEECVHSDSKTVGKEETKAESTNCNKIVNPVENPSETGTLSKNASQEENDITNTLENDTANDKPDVPSENAKKEKVLKSKETKSFEKVATKNNVSLRKFRRPSRNQDTTSNDLDNNKTATDNTIESSKDIGDEIISSIEKQIVDDSVPLETNAKIPEVTAALLDCDADSSDMKTTKSETTQPIVEKECIKKSAYLLGEKEQNILNNHQNENVITKEKPKIGRPRKNNNNTAASTNNEDIIRTTRRSSRFTKTSDEIIEEKSKLQETTKTVSLGEKETKPIVKLTKISNEKSHVIEKNNKVIESESKKQKSEEKKKLGKTKTAGIKVRTSERTTRNSKATAENVVDKSNSGQDQSINETKKSKQQIEKILDIPEETHTTSEPAIESPEEATNTIEIIEDVSKLAEKNVKRGRPRRKGGQKGRGLIKGQMEEGGISSPQSISSSQSLSKEEDEASDNGRKRRYPSRRQSEDTGSSKAVSVANSPKIIEASIIVDSSGSSDDDVLEVPETDPLDCGTKSVTLSTFSLDFTEDVPAPVRSHISLRKRSREETPQNRQDKGIGAKKMKLKGRRTMDSELRKSIEEKKNQNLVVSSDEDNDKQGDGTKSTIVISSDEEKKPKKPRGRRKRDENEKLLHLGIDISQIIVTGEDGSAGVRQSRRIAQQKIKEEAIRKEIEEGISNPVIEKKRRRSKKSEKLKLKVDKAKAEENEETTEEDDSRDSKKKKKKKKKHKPFDEMHPWRSSSDSSATEEEFEEEEVEEEEDEALHFASDHEFSPESDVEGDESVQPLKRARTAKKESDIEETDDCPCQKCNKSDHPEWILLCDKCDNGWHCSCLRPPLLVIPEGDWFCPPCQHNRLLTNLEEKLAEYDKRIIKKQLEDRRKERLAYVGISLNNVLPAKGEKKKKPKRILDDYDDEDEDGDSNNAKEDLDADANIEDDGESESDDEDESGSPTSSSSSSSTTEQSEDEPIYQLRQRRQAHSYRFTAYDELISSAIGEDIDAGKGAGNQGRGKDIATIVNANIEEEKELAAAAAAAAQNQQQQEEEQQNENTGETGEEKPPPVVPLLDKDKEAKPLIFEKESDQNIGIIKIKKRLLGRRKHRKLNALDINSEDDDDEGSDEDFKGSSEESDDEFEDDYGSGDSELLESARRRKKGNDPVRRSTRARTSRYDADFIDDADSDDTNVASRRRKKRALWYESSSTESDRSWGRNKRKAGGRSQKKSQSATTSPSKRKKSKKKKKNEDSDVEVYRKKKPKIKYGLDDDDDDDEGPVRRTRGKKINYLDALGTDSDDEKVKRPPPKIESDEEYVADEEEKDVTTFDETTTAAAQKTINDPTKIQIQSYTNATFTEILPDTVKDALLPEDLDEENPILQINRTLEMMDENEMEKLMEEEEYANKQLQLMAMQLEKEKRRKEREAKKIEEAQLAKKYNVDTNNTSPIIEGQLSKENRQEILPTLPPSRPATVLQNEQFPFRRNVQEVEMVNVENPPPVLQKEQFPFRRNMQEPSIANAENPPPILQKESFPFRRNLQEPIVENPVPPILQKESFPFRRNLQESIVENPPPVLQKESFPLRRNLQEPNVENLSQNSETNDELSEPPGVTLPLFSELVTTPSEVVENSNKKRKSRPRKTLEEAVANLGSVRAQGTSESFLLSRSPKSTPPPAETNIEIAAPPQPFSASQPTPSVITRMLQTKPGQPGYPIGAIRAKPFASMPDERSPAGTPPPPYRPQIFRQMNHFRPQHLFSGGGQINVESPAGSPSDKATPPPPPPPPPYQRPPPPRFSRGAPTAPPPYQSAYYGQFQEEAMPPTIYQTPYEGFEGQPAAGSERGEGSSKSFEEEGSGEFGGLVSYFSSQREDDLES